MSEYAHALADILKPYGFEWNNDGSSVSWIENDTYLVLVRGSIVTITTTKWHIKYEKQMVYDLSDPESLNKIVDEVKE